MPRVHTSLIMANQNVGSERTTVGCVPQQHKPSLRGEKNVLVFPIKAFATLSQVSVHSTAPSKQHHNNHEGKKILLNISEFKDKRKYLNC